VAETLWGGAGKPVANPVESGGGVRAPSSPGIRRLVQSRSLRDFRAAVGIGGGGDRCQWMVPVVQYFMGEFRFFAGVGG